MRGISLWNPAPVERSQVMVDTRIKPYLEQKAESEAREQQRRLALRHQALGLVLIAAAILVWRLLHTNPGWIFPAGWWRL